MSGVTRSNNNVHGDSNVTGGDVVITDSDKGIVLTDDVGGQSRIKIVDDNGTKTITVEEIS